MLGHPGLSTDSYHSQPSPAESFQPGVLPVQDEADIEGKVLAPTSTTTASENDFMMEREFSLSRKMAWFGLVWFGLVWFVETFDLCDVMRISSDAKLRALRLVRQSVSALTSVSDCTFHKQ